MKDIVDNPRCVMRVLDVKVETYIIYEVNIPPSIILCRVIDKSELSRIKKRIKINVSIRPIIYWQSQCISFNQPILNVSIVWIASWESFKPYSWSISRKRSLCWKVTIKKRKVSRPGITNVAVQHWNHFLKARIHSVIFQCDWSSNLSLWIVTSDFHYPSSHRIIKVEHSILNKQIQRICSLKWNSMNF